MCMFFFIRYNYIFVMEVDWEVDYLFVGVCIFFLDNFGCIYIVYYEYNVFINLYYDVLVIVVFFILDGFVGIFGFGVGVIVYILYYFFFILEMYGWEFDLDIIIIVC